MTERSNAELDHRQLGVDLFNQTWTLLDRDDRTTEEDDEMVNAAHASCWHWSRFEGAGPENAARGHWQCSRVYAVLDRGEPAVHHARRCLAICEANGIGDWDLAFAYEALARALAVAGDIDEAARHKRLAREAGDAIEEAEDREAFDADYATLL
jgi:hypothetical protein